ncbi:wax ester/triacylglycerol synthase family O-acyltransferase [Rhodococcus maanshanensis]|uniref:wax ester/triacylglycerol synthase family O-acyltransferase n=1 Tax=Rhodococcus maanshanensis TaxID=183556 RepID=UPI0022B36174|nr:wax ester/triacylglycerol synthase family O-acyltransferase [Rhodococcus maanshanensis]MCZ4558658.1 wax ester/triacylglycerol synthase family O-acyltransferase [Rhodococcus maanshanensis]
MDASFLEVEDADEQASLAIAAIAVLEGPTPTRSEFAAAVEPRIDAIPRARQVARRLPLDLGLPEWVEVEAFDLDHHLRRTALPAPGDQADLCRLISDIMAVRLDRKLPLWECWVVEGLEHGRWALIMKLHHCMADGISGTRLFEALCDEADRATGGAAQPTIRVRRNSPGTFVTAPLALARWLVGEMRSPRKAVADIGGLVTGTAVLAGRVLWPATASSLNGPLARQRRYGIARASLPEVAEICDAFGVTINDVALAAVSGAVRRQLLRRGELPGPHTVRSLVPVSYRPRDGGATVLDNEVSLALPYLPIDVADPVDRLRAVHSRMSTAKSDGEPGAGHAAAELAKLVPFAPLAWVVRMFLRIPQRSVATVTTNIPGPRVPLHILGRRVVELLPYVPIAVRLRLGVAIMSYGEQLAFGATGDFDHMPDLDELCADIEADLRDLLGAAREGG